VSDLHDRFVFAGNRSLVKEVHVAGKRLVADGRHGAAEKVAADYREALRTLLSV
jgi:formimidoylglutamate deiminase